MALNTSHYLQQSPLGRFKAFAGRHGSSVRVGIIGIIVLAIVAFFMLHTAGQAPVHQAPTITMVTIQPQKPPPPPPPPPQQKMIVQPKMTVPETKPMIPNQPPKPAPPKASAAPSTAPPLGTSIHNNGPADAFDLSGDAGGNGLIGGGGGGGGGSRWGWYQSIMQTAIGQALQKNDTTKNANFQMQVRIWMDSSGVITRAVLTTSSGDPKVDASIEHQVLPGLHINPPPPIGMPMPVVTSFNQLPQQ